MTDILLQRSRQLKKTQPMPIVREEVRDAIAVSAAVTEGLCGMDKSEKKEEHIKSATKGISAIPVPGQ